MLKKELWNKNLAKKRKKHSKLNYSRHPILAAVGVYIVMGCTMDKPFLVERRIGNSRLGVYRRNLCEVMVSKA